MPLCLGVRVPGGGVGHGLCWGCVGGVVAVSTEAWPHVAEHPLLFPEEARGGEVVVCLPGRPHHEAKAGGGPVEGRGGVGTAGCPPSA